MNVNHVKLDRELREAGIPIVGVCEDGRVDYARELDAGETVLAESIISTHDPLEYALESNRSSIRGDGEETATVTVQAVWPERPQWTPTEIDVDVNGVAVNVLLAGGVGSLELVSDTPGDVIVVSLGGQSVSIWVV